MPTLTRSEFDAALNLFMVELNHICKNMTEDELRRLEKHQFGDKIDDHLTDLKESLDSPAQALYGAFGYLDEFISADREKVFQAAFSAYCLSRKQSRPWWRFW